MQRMRLAALLLMGSLVAFWMVIPVFASAPASAQMTCAANECNGSDAYTTGCAGNDASYWVVSSVPVISRGTNAGWVQLWWSQTCGTNWARYVCSQVCQTASLTLLRCAPNGDRYAMPDLESLSGTGHTAQYSLPTTKAEASLAFQIGEQAYAQVSTGCY